MSNLISGVRNCAVRIDTYVLLVSIVLLKNEIKISAFQFLPLPNSYKVIRAGDSCLDLTNQ